jgi:hypothetical protein
MSSAVVPLLPIWAFVACYRVYFHLSLAYWFETTKYINCYIKTEFQSLAFYILHAGLQLPSVTAGWCSIRDFRTRHSVYMTQTSGVMKHSILANIPAEEGHLPNRDDIVCTVTRLQVGRLGVRVQAET